MREKATDWRYQVVFQLVRLFSPKFLVTGVENLPGEPCVIVGNHSQMYGPIAAEIYTPVKHDIWCAAEMMNRKEVAAYAYQDFWSGKPRSVRWFYRLLSHMIGPIAELIFTNAHTIPVYHDMRIVSTFRESVRKLQAGSSMVIFPEHYAEHNSIIYEFRDRFVDLATLYYRKTGRELCFVPMYLAPRLKLMIYGEPVCFRADAPAEKERKRICSELMNRITGIAVSLPEHTVVPYPNIPKRRYPKSTPVETVSNEEES